MAAISRRRCDRLDALCGGISAACNVRCDVLLHETDGSRSFIAKPVNARVQKHRDALRKAGLRLVQIWVPDTGRPGFDAECARQCALAWRYF
jgi:hypothetical protein